MANFKIGDIVQLKSGGPEMTVVSVDTSGDGVWCSWLAGKKNERAHFPLGAIVPATSHSKKEK